MYTGPIDGKPRCYHCSNCNDLKISNVKLVPGCCVFSSMIGLCICCCWWISCIPFCINDCYDVYHYCPDCNTVIKRKLTCEGYEG